MKGVFPSMSSNPLLLLDNSAMMSVINRGVFKCTDVTFEEAKAILEMHDEDDVILISQEGIVIRMHAADINLQSRYGSGVRVMRLAEGDRVVTVARTEHSDDAVTEKPEDEPEETLTEAELAAIQAEENAQAEEQPEDEGEE